MSCDKRRYLPRNPRDSHKPTAPTGGKNAAADGYTIRHREPMRVQKDGYVWQRDTDVAPSLQMEPDDGYSSYDMD